MLVTCQHEGCTNTIETEPGVRFTCREHSGPAVQDIFFQKHQFDLPLDSRKAWAQLSAELEYRGGFRLFTLRDIQGEVPEWAESNTQIQQIIERSFPQWRANAQQFMRAGRWARVIYLHYRLHLTLKAVADEMEISEVEVRNVLNRVKRVASGRRANNTAKKAKI